MQENAVQIVTGFFCRDRETGAVDQFGQRLGRKFETGRQIAFNDCREIVTRQCRERETAATGLDRHAVIRGFQTDLAAFRQLAGDIEQQVRRYGDRASAFHRGGAHILDHLQVEIGRHHFDRSGFVSLDQHIRQDRNGVAAFDHRLNVGQTAQQRSAFDCGLHRVSIPYCARVAGIASLRR